MADKSFGVKELNLLNASGTPTVTSPNNLNLNANTVAISTSCTIGNNLTVTSTTNSANLNVTGVGTLTRAFATDLSVSGISTISQPSNANPHSLWDVVNNSSSSYRFTGPGVVSTDDNPNIYLVRGQRYVFKVNASGHDFYIKTEAGTGTGNQYTDGVTGNGAATGNVVFNVQHDAPPQLKYQCVSHGAMVGNIYIVGNSEVISGVTTFSNGINVSGGTLDVATSLRKSSGTLDYLAATHTFANVAGSTEYFRFASSGQLGIAGANYGSSGQVLTSAGSGSAVTWSAIPAQATIANNADNRVITGGSGVNLNGESGLTYNGTRLDVTTGDLQVIGGEGGNAELRIVADQGDDGADYWRFQSAASGNNLNIATYASGAWVDKVSIASDGDIGVGVASPDGRFHIMGGNLGGAGSVTADTAGNLLVLESNNSNGMSLLNANDERANIYFGTSGTDGQIEAGIQYAHEAVSTTADRRAMIFRVGGGERARIQTGRLLVGRTNPITITGDGSSHVFEQLDNNGYAVGLHCDQSNQRGLGIYYNTSRSPSDAIRFVVGSSAKFIVLGSGNVQNANNSYGNISDVSLKENIIDAGSQWNDIKNIKIRNYNFKESTGQETHKQIGVVAQELETVCPKLVSTDQDGMKNVASSVLYMKAVKALQEAMAKIETLEAKVAALEGS